MGSIAKTSASKIVVICALAGSIGFLFGAVFLLIQSLSGRTSAEGSILRAGLGVLSLCIGLFLFAVSSLIRRPPDAPNTEAR